ncbi:MAG: enoyl-[acyl-carrier-protein] reductase FabL [Chloroflexota bacterium]|nr:enoyl-[acyl-carrier-protein] reductase FabL [Chloroflexota bacterium]MDE2942313.1 enoyl-[acyl-carrier-protein] reductase FabL [Chloroflexota bacterium]MDE3268283.1 enoyl-[acyl-carrier-protein] reductase FabL [Chloroflexota bacterium]
MSLSGRVALVTGGSRGIGRAICLELARQGADVVVGYARNQKEAAATADEVRALGVRSLTVRSHLGDPGRVRDMFRRVEREFGRLDILVNNAASGVQRTALELETKHWDWTMDVNTRAPWLCAKEAARLMPNGGHIVNISSMGSGLVLKNYLAVGVSKAGLEALTRYLAVELAPKGIIVNAVAGGVVDTDALRHFPNRDEMLGDSEERTPAGRLVTPEDMAKAVAFLCSDGAEMVRGHVLVVDGGISLLGL